MLLAAWLLKTSLGRTSLQHSRIRRHAMPIWIIVPIFFLWTVPPMLMMAAINPWLRSTAQWQQALWGNIVMGISSLGTIAVILVLGYGCFARRLTGLGLGGKRLHKDFGSACVNLLTVWPLVLALILVVTMIQQSLHGPKYHIQQHEELNYLVQFNQWPLRLSIVIMAVILAPVVEELIFRGILQTTIRSIIHSPWIAIVLSSSAFAAAHANKEHWPSLFVLGLAIGYAYEKSGSLWQAIFVHALFNGITIASYLIQSS